MYTPKYYAVEDRSKLLRFMQNNSFGILFSHTGFEPMASHLPLMIDESGGEQGLILGHMAKANRQWRYADGQQVMVVFHGPHTYVSPTWYQEEETVAEEEETVAEEEVASEEEEQVEEESTEVVEETNEEETEETQEEESSSETATASTVSSKKSAKQKKVRSKKSLMANMERMMDKVDEDVKDLAKNLALKNIIKIKAMASEQASLDLYKNALFYKPKDIYLEQLNIFDNRQIYDNVNLASYIKTDKVAIKANALHEINLKKQRLLIELEQLKNGNKI